MKERKFKAVENLLSEKHIGLNKMLHRHMKKYEWVSSEYTGAGWETARWLEEIAKFVDSDPVAKIREIARDETEKTRAKRELIGKLKLNKNSHKVIEALECFSVMRDWSKGLFTKALLDHRYLMTEMAKRLGISLNDLLCFNINEVGRIFINGKINKKEVELRRKNGAVMFMAGKNKKIYHDRKNIDKIKRMDIIKEMFDDKKDIKEFSGRTAFPGLAKGRVRVVIQSKDIQKVERGDILVTYMTTMEFTPVFKKISALITDEGGISSHAAIISREFKIPCIIGSKVSTRTLKNGDLVEIDASKGIVRVLN